MLSFFCGGRTKLGKAEQFFWVIKDIHHYGDRLKAWAFKLKCREQMEELRPVRDPSLPFARTQWACARPPRKKPS